MNKYLIVFFISIFCGKVEAQKIGLNKKSIYVSYSSIISPTFFSPTFNGRVGKLGMNLTHELSISKIRNKRREVSFYYHYGRTSFYYDESPSFYVSFWEGFIKGSEDYVSPYKIGINTFGTSFRYYRDKFLGKKRWVSAPYGPYIDLKPHLTTLLIGYKQDKKSDFNKLIRVSSPGITFGFGRQRVVSKKYLLSLGTQYTVPFKVFTLGIPRSLQESFINTAIGRVYSRVFFEVKLGIGVLVK